jgi:hypothetical protein
MPWNSEYYPPSMQHLPKAVREKAIEIALAHRYMRELRPAAGLESIGLKQ